MSKFEPIDLSKVSTHPIRERGSKVGLDVFARPPGPGATVTEWLSGLPEVLAARDLRAVIAAWVDGITSGRPVVLAMGGHPIKCGLGPVLRQLVEAGALSAVAMNGAASIHDYEVALVGATSEDVEESLHRGTFGMSEETGAGIHAALREGLERGWGYGEALGRHIDEAALPGAHESIAACCLREDVQLTVHVAMGTDVVHQHPAMDGRVVGEMTHRDFLRFGGAVRSLCSEGGLYVNLGSAVVLPEVFLKALAICRNLDGVGGAFDTLDMDMERRYRPTENVVRRPTSAGGRGYRLLGHHEIMLPLLAHCVLEGLRERRDEAGR